jgi:hypothetical protein
MIQHVAGTAVLFHNCNTNYRHFSNALRLLLLADVSFVVASQPPCCPQINTCPERLVFSRLIVGTKTLPRKKTKQRRRTNTKRREQEVEWTSTAQSKLRAQAHAASVAADTSLEGPGTVTEPNFSTSGTDPRTIWTRG